MHQIFFFFQSINTYKEEDRIREYKRANICVTSARAD